MAGDQTLIGEINANAESTAPIAEVARATLVGISGPTLDPPSDEQDQTLRHRLEHERARNHGLTNVISAMCILNSLNPMWRTDTVMVRQLEDQVRVIMAPV